MRFDGAANLTAGLQITLSVGGGGMANLSAGFEGAAARGISIAGLATSVRGSSVNMACGGCRVNVTDSAVLGASGAAGIAIQAGSVSLAGADTALYASRVSVSAADSATIAASLPGLLATNSSPANHADLRVVSHGSVQLGDHDSQWRLGSAVIIAGDVLVSHQTVRTEGDTCGNGQSGNSDACAAALQTWPSGVLAGKVSFDFVVVARDGLQIQFASIFAASALLCSGGRADLAERVTIDSSGRGCGPGEGQGHGEARALWASCGAAGGSHLGSGGAGGKYDGDGVLTGCAVSGPIYDTPEDLLMSDQLPTQGASGGGCAEEEDACLFSDIQRPSAGGGLIWLSGKDVLFGSDVRMLADGNPGKVVTVKRERIWETVSGGGAGGQILLYASTLGGMKEQPAWLSARGGAIECTESEVGGAGGGGFIGLGLNFTRDTEPSAVADIFQISVGGGVLLEKCKGWVPKKNLYQAFGQPGGASNLMRCAAGLAGMFCLPCPVGAWSANGSDCLACTNKPKLEASYTTAAWTNSDCPYICAPGVPHVSTNPMCDNAPRYFFDFIGGLAGTIVIATILVVSAGALLWRRRRQRLHFDNRARNEMMFSKEKLPYHICRIYFSGQNDWLSPWGMMGGSLPAAIEPIVLLPQWEQFLADANNLSRVAKREAFWVKILQLLYPPLASVYAHRRRWQRAQGLCACVRHFSGGCSGRMDFWKPIRARFQTKFEMAFGCDQGATLGFLDFFDFNRSQFDWVPVDEARVLMAHGHGSYSEPFGIDVEDPLVHHLTQTNQASAIFNVIATFNRIAKTMPKDELQECSVGPMVLRLRAKVEQCERLNWRNGFVHVVLFPDSRPKPGAQQRPQSTQSFCDLLGERNQLPSPLSRRQRSPSLLSSRITSSEAAAEIRLGLAFVEAENLRSAEQCGFRGACSPASLEPAAEKTADPLTSPIPCKVLAEHLEKCSSIPHRAASRSRLLGAVHRASAISCSARSTTSTVFLALILFIYIDMLASVFDFALLYHLDWRLMLIWLFFPPLTQPGTFVMGLVFLLSESPRKGRIFALLAVFGILNSLISTTIYFLVVGLDSVLFEVTKLLTICVLKATLFVFANIHVRNLEEANFDHHPGPAAAAPNDSLDSILSRRSRHQMDRTPSTFTEPSPSKAPEVVMRKSSSNDECSPNVSSSSNLFGRAPGDAAAASREGPSPF